MDRCYIRCISDVVFCCYNVFVDCMGKKVVKDKEKFEFYVEVLSFSYVVGCLYNVS